MDGRFEQGVAARLNDAAVMGVAVGAACGQGHFNPILLGGPGRCSDAERRRAGAGAVRGRLVCARSAGAGAVPRPPRMRAQRGSDSLVLLVPPRHMSIADLDIMRDVGIQGHISARASIRITSTCSWGSPATTSRTLTLPPFPPSPPLHAQTPPQRPKGRRTKLDYRVP